jgi:ABC-type multidrug transport system ATPase subunit
MAGLGGFKQVARRLADAGGLVLYTTQLAPLAVEFSDWILLLDKGRLARWEKTESIRQQLSRTKGDASDLFPGLRATRA